MPALRMRQSAGPRGAGGVSRRRCAQEPVGKHPGAKSGKQQRGSRQGGAGCQLRLATEGRVGGGAGGVPRVTGGSWGLVLGVRGPRGSLGFCTEWIRGGWGKARWDAGRPAGATDAPAASVSVGTGPPPAISMSVGTLWGQRWTSAPGTQTGFPGHPALSPLRRVWPTAGGSVGRAHSEVRAPGTGLPLPPSPVPAARPFLPPCL